MLDRTPVDDQTNDIIKAAIRLRGVFDLLVQINNRSLSHPHYQNDLGAQSFNQLMIQSTPVGIVGGGEQALHYGYIRVLDRSLERSDNVSQKLIETAARN